MKQNLIAKSVLNISSNFQKFKVLVKQECIPVGCVPSAAVAICLGGGLPRGVCGGRGVSAPGRCLPMGVCVSQHALRQTPPCRQNSWDMLVKILPCRNFAADFKDSTWREVPRPFDGTVCCSSYASCELGKFVIWQKVISPKKFKFKSFAFTRRNTPLSSRIEFDYFLFSDQRNMSKYRNNEVASKTVACWNEF